MTRLSPAELPAFLRGFRFPGGRIRRVKVRYDTADQMTVEVIVFARTAMKSLAENARPVHLRFRLAGVEEFRFQKRPSTPAGKVADARIAYFGDSFFLNLDAFALDPGEQPKPHDFRASDAYAAGRELWWEEIARKKSDP